MSRAAAIAALALLAQAMFSVGVAAIRSDGGFAAETLAGQVFEQRKDVDEVSRPLPPSGPATPVPFCGPSAPICP